LRSSQCVARSVPSLMSEGYGDLQIERDQSDKGCQGSEKI
jgi:hypothetical protein